MKQLRAILEKVILKHFAASSVYGLNSSLIPVKKLENVKTLHHIKNEEVLFVYDTTLFGSAKDGMVFTDKGIYWREVLDSPQNLDYKALIESTVNNDLKTRTIFVLGDDKPIQIKEIYYKLMSDLRLDFISSSMVYETYYKTALTSATESLTRLLERKKYTQIIEWLSRYEGLFLKSKHKSLRLREISFQAYLMEGMFPKAKEQLDFIEDKNPKFYSKAAPILERATREAEYERLERERIVATTAEDYGLALSLLAKQANLNIREEFEIEQIKRTIEESKKSVLANYLTQLNLLLKDEKFVDAKTIEDQIYKIDPTYSLEREKILLTIYQYDIRKAKEEIAQVSDPNLKIELEEILQKTTKKLYENIRSAARNKTYDMFEKYPDIWTITDEYGMSALCYFALEADLEGILKALDKTEILLMPANIFGHNFVDLICLACDPNLGNKKANPLTLLKKIKQKIDLQQIDKRIKFLETGQERHFFSYKLSQEEKLSELNQTLISANFFKQILVEIENNTYNNVDKIIRHLFSRELEDMASYPQKDEFESSQDYRIRAKAFRRQYLNRFDFIAEYKKQNQPMVEAIDKILKEKKSCFIPTISGLIEYKDKNLDALRALESQEKVLELMDFYFPEKEDIITVEVGRYDADKEVFLLHVNGEAKEIRVPLAIAKEYRATFEEVAFVERRVIEEGKIVRRTVPRFL